MALRRSLSGETITAATRLSAVRTATVTPTAIIDRPPDVVPTGPSQDPNTYAMTNQEAVAGFVDQGLPKSVAESLVASGSWPTMMNLTPNSGGFSQPTGGGGGGFDLGSLARRGLDIVEDAIRGRLVPGSSGGNASSTVPGAGNLTVPTSTRCPDGSLAVMGRCLNLPGGPTTGGGMVLSYGEAVMGRYGAALVPASKTTATRHCPRGSVLANDGLCYNRRDIRKSDRMWVPGRKPLLTGGDLNAISRAATAAGKMKTQSKRLQKLGLLPKPSTRRAPARRARGGNGITVIDTD